jgi:hypothetical protein
MIEKMDKVGGDTFIITIFLYQTDGYVSIYSVIYLKD